MTDTAQDSGDATIIAPGVEAGDATVISQGMGDATVVVSRPDAPSGAARVVTMDMAQLRPQVEYSLRAHNTHALAGQTTQNYLLADIKAFFAGGLEGRAPVALALAIDRSGSMEGKPIESVKTAVSLIIDQLGDADLVSIVTFREHVETLMPASRVINRELIKQHVERIRPKGTTNLFSGMMNAGEQLLGAKTPLHLGRVLLLTDGEANEGIVEYHDIVSGARDLRARGLTVSTVGLGIEYNEELMKGIAKNTRGNYYYIDSIDLIPEVFDKELKDIFGTVATQVGLTLKLADGVEATHVYGYEAAKGGSTVSIDLPDLVTGETLPVLIQLGAKSHPRARFRLAQSELRFKYFGQTDRKTLRGDFVAEFTDDKDAILGGIDPIVESAMREKDIVANIKRATQMMSSDVGTATMIIEQAEAQLKAAGKEQDATLVGVALGKLKAGSTQDATKTLSMAEYDLEHERRKG